MTQENSTRSAAADCSLGSLGGVGPQVDAPPRSLGSRCPACVGSGRIFHGDWQDTYEVECPFCRGTGTAERRSGASRGDTMMSRAANHSNDATP